MNQDDKTMSVIDESLPYELMDSEDEKQILAEMKGEVITAFVYSFQDKSGREVTGLSKVGVDNVCRESANKGEVFRVIGDPIIQDSEDAINFVVKVGRFALRPDGKGVMLDTTLGAKRQLKKKLIKNKMQDDPFFFETGLSKAERNAKRKLLPEKMILEMIKKFKAEGKVKNLRPNQPYYKKPIVEKEERVKFDSEYIDKNMANTLNATRAKYETMTKITPETFKSFLSIYYDVNKLSEIRLEDYAEILGALQDRSRFEQICNERDDMREEPEKGV